MPVTTIQLASTFTALGWQFDLQQRTAHAGYYKVLPTAESNWANCWYAAVEYQFSAVEDNERDELAVSVTGSKVWMCFSSADALAKYTEIKNCFLE